MQIKKHETGNEYVHAGSTWIRNFTKKVVVPVNISNLFSFDDFSLAVRNEELNKNFPKISNEKISFDKVVIVSDGIHFEERHKIISDFPKEVAVLAVNKALKKWKLYGPAVPKERRRTINAYVVNNPYKECLSFLPAKDLKYYPTCVASKRTNADFLRKYAGSKYTFCPTPETGFGIHSPEEYYIDDYRNTVCAAIGLAHQFGAKKIMLLCCDDSFEEEREYSVKLENGLHTYPQHIRSQQIIDGNLYWLTHQEEIEIAVADYSDGPKYVNAAYISNEEDALNFFRDTQEGNPDV